MTGVIESVMLALWQPGIIHVILLDRISIDPEICGGKPCVKGTRLWVALVLDFLSDGMTEGELLAEYPQLTHQGVLAAIAYAPKCPASGFCRFRWSRCMNEGQIGREHWWPRD